MMDKIRWAIRAKLRRKIDVMWWCVMLGTFAMMFLVGRLEEDSIWSFLSWAIAIVIGVSIAGIITWYCLVEVLFDVVKEVREDVKLGGINCETIACRRLYVVNPDETPQVEITVNGDGGCVKVRGKDDGVRRPRISMEASEDGGRIYIKSDSSSASLGATGSVGGYVSVNRHSGRAFVGVDDHGGIIGVEGIHEGSGAEMRVDGLGAYGYGGVVKLSGFDNVMADVEMSTWDKNGYRQ